MLVQQARSRPRATSPTRGDDRGTGTTHDDHDHHHAGHRHDHAGARTTTTTVPPATGIGAQDLLNQAAAKLDQAAGGARGRATSAVPARSSKRPATLVTQAQQTLARSR